MKYSEILTKAKALIENEENWTTGAFARDEYGKPVARDNPKACKFCALGALYKAMEYDTNHHSGEPFRYLREAAFYLWQTKTIAVVNDNNEGKHKNIMKLYDLAIKLAKEDGE